MSELLVAGNDTFLDQLDLDIQHAGPNEDILGLMRFASYAVLCGTSNSGKDTALRMFFEEHAGQNGNPDSHPVLTRVSRDPRKGERVGHLGSPGQYYDLDAIGVRGGLRRAILAGEFVQIIFHKELRVVYATGAGDYRPDPKLIEAPTLIEGRESDLKNLWNSGQATAEEARRLKLANIFGNFMAIYFVPEPQPLLDHWAARDGDKPADRLKRFNEATVSLRLCTDQELDAIIVPQDYDGTAAKHIAAILRGERDKDLLAEGRLRVVELRKRVAVERQKLLDAA